MWEQISIGILIYPGAQISAIYGLMDLFSSANRIAMEKAPQKKKPLNISRWQVAPDSEQGEEILRLPAPDDDPLNRLTVIIIPPNLNSQGEEEPDLTIIEWLKAQHQSGAIVCSICTAVFILARTGLLSGRAVTTHWALKEKLADKFPDIRVQTNKMVIEDGDIITAGGVTAWIDLGLCLIERFLSPSVMLEVAQFFLIDPNSREQSFYNKFAPKLYHADADILKVQHWLQNNYNKSILIADLASIAVLNQRTFLRRFKKATGMKPIEYLQALRISKTRELLEFSQTSLTEISEKVGYEDPNALRKIFQRLVGLQPREYRRRFNVGRIG